MLLTTIAAAVLLSTPADGAGTTAPTQARAAETHGKLPWFSGTIDEALAKAKAEKKVIFIDFWTTTCGWCKKLDKVTYSDDTVVAAMKDVLCLSIDAESETGRPLAAKYPITGFPTMVILDPDGSTRDILVGYKDPAPFKVDMDRILADKGTSGDFKRQVEADKTSVDKRWSLAKKLKQLGAQKGYDAEVEEIRKLDPKGESEAMHRVAFDAMLAKAEALFGQGKADDAPALFEAILADEKYDPILWDGWMILSNIHGQLGQNAAQMGKEDERKKHNASQVADWRKAWPHVPESEFVGFSAYLASNLWDRRAALTDDDKLFALELGKKLEPKVDKDANALDTVACCYFMNGKKDDALKLVRKCIELDPTNDEIKQRLTEFGG